MKLAILAILVICITAQASMDDFLDAVEQVESGGDSHAIGDGGRAVGAFQIHKIFVDDVNRILRSTRFDYAERLNPRSSRVMIILWLQHYASKERLGRSATFEDMARMINGGPDGHKKKSTIEYWEKVKARMNGNQPHI